MRKNNLLEYKPMLTPNTIVKSKTDENAVIEITHKGFYAFICSKLLKKPEKTEITLDSIGSYLISLIDGEKTVYEISHIEPLYPRLIKYLQLLIRKKVIVLKK